MTKCLMLAETDPVLSIFHLCHCPAYCPGAHSTRYPPEWSFFYLPSSYECPCPKKWCRSPSCCSKAISQPRLSSAISHRCGVSWSAFHKSFVKAPGLYFASLLKTHLYQDAYTVACLLLIAKWVVCWESLKFFLLHINPPKKYTFRSETCYYPITSMLVLAEPWTRAPQVYRVGLYNGLQ